MYKYCSSVFNSRFFDIFSAPEATGRLAMAGGSVSALALSVLIPPIGNAVGNTVVSISVPVGILVALGSMASAALTHKFGTQQFSPTTDTPPTLPSTHLSQMDKTNSFIFKEIEKKNIFAVKSIAKEEMEFLSEFQESWNNPLSIEQMYKLKSFCDYFLLEHRNAAKNPTVASLHFSRPAFYHTKSFYQDHHLKNGGNFKKFIKKFYTNYGSSYELDNRKEISEQELIVFLHFVKNPAVLAKEFGLKDKISVLAATKFVKSVLTHFKKCDCLAEYLPFRIRQVCEIYDGFYEKKWKYQMVANGPLCEYRDFRFHPIRAVCSSIYIEPSFMEEAVEDTAQARNQFKELGVQYTSHSDFGLIFTPTRELILAKTMDWLKDVYIKNAHLKLILDVYAKLTSLNNLKVFLFQDKSRCPIYTLKTSDGYYNNKNSVYAHHFYKNESGFIKEGSGNNEAATFFHEISHLIMEKLFNGFNRGAIAKIFDEVLAKDRQFRSSPNFKKENLSEKSQSIFRTMVTSLEKNRLYFPDAFDDQNPVHLRTMRVEAIVRPIEQMAFTGATEEDFLAVAPNLYRFYVDHIEPRLRAFVSEAAENV